MQFADGSTWGDVNANPGIAESLGDRKLAYGVLDRALLAYQSSGGQAMLDHLGSEKGSLQPPTHGASLSMQKHVGTEATVASNSDD